MFKLKVPKMEDENCIGWPPDKPQPPSSRALAPRQPSRRSGVTNGSKQFIAGDENSAWARRRYDLVALHAADLGGAEHLSEAELSLCRRVATLELELEVMEGKLSLGADVDLDLYNRLAGNLRRCLETIGLKRVTRDVGSDYLLEHFSRPPKDVSNA
jgi:hypothetical protein